MKEKNTYFDSRASFYKSKRNFIWNWFKKQEIKHFKKIKNISKSHKIIDIGCGTGIYSDILYQKGISDITCIDCSSRMLEHFNNDKIKLINTDFMTYKTDEKFDIILCMGILEFIVKTDLFFQKIVKILNKDGKIIFLIPQKNIISLLYRRYHKINGKDIIIRDIKEILYFFDSKIFSSNIINVSSLSTILILEKI